MEAMSTIWVALCNGATVSFPYRRMPPWACRHKVKTGQVASRKSKRHFPSQPACLPRPHLHHAQSFQAPLSCWQIVEEATEYKQKWLQDLQESSSKRTAWPLQTTNKSGAGGGVLLSHSSPTLKASRLIYTMRGMTEMKLKKEKLNSIQHPLSN